jgi:hypothetical protein
MKERICHEVIVTLKMELELEQQMKAQMVEIMQTKRNDLQLVV